MKAVIIAGGKGTRLGLEDIPKPMVSVVGKPLLEHQLILLKQYGIYDVTILTGFLSTKIEDYFGDGKSLGMNINYVKEPYPLGTAGAVLQLEGALTERFLVLYGDVVMDFDIERFLVFDKKDDSIGSLIVHPNDHPQDSDLVEIDSSNLITSFISKPHAEGLQYQNLVNAAVYILSPEIFNYIPKGVASDFGKDIFPNILLTKGKLRAYLSPEYIKDLGTKDRLKKVENDLISGKVARWNLKNSRPAVFIDRDGVINKEVDNLRRIDDFEILPCVEKAIKKINNTDFLAIIVTNQPAVAKGFLSLAELDNIHKLLETKLGIHGAFVNKIYFCPHHPEKGFEGEVPDLKINCECRKPGIGMIKQACSDFNIDLSKSYFIGDTTTDLKTAQNAGLKSVLVNTGYGGKDLKFEVTAKYTANDLNDAIDLILTQITP